MACAATYGRLLDDVVTGRLTARGWAQLRAHLAFCQSCRKQYTRAVYVERLLSGGPEALHLPAPTELLRIGDAVISQVPGAQPKAGLAAAWSWLRWLVPVTACAAIAAIAVVAVPAWHASHRPDEVAQATVPVADRGPAADRQGPARLRAFCVNTDAVLDSVGGKPRVVELRPKDSCGAQSDLLRLAYSNDDPRYKYLTVVGLDAGLDIKWYEPRSADGQSVAIRPGQDVALGEGVRLGVQHKAGPLRVVSIFSEQPLSGTVISGAVERARAQRRDLSSLAALDGLPTGVYQSSFVVELR